MDDTGFTVREQYGLGTNPTNNQSIFMIEQVLGNGGNHPVVRWRSVGGRQYGVEAVMEMEDPTANGVSVRFYRIRLVPPGET